MANGSFRVGKGVHCFNGIETNPGKAPECSERARLLQEYNHDITELDRAAKMLKRETPPLSKIERESISTFVETLRTRVEEARIALEQHTAEHGCD